MTTTPYVVPTYRGLTIVGTALTRDASGDMVHHVVVDSTSPGGEQPVYEIIATAPERARG